MTTKSQIEELLRDAFSPDFIEVRDVSEGHSGHAGARPGGETHFEVFITSKAFTGKSRIQSHRLIHGILEPFLRTSVHALALNVKSS